MTEDSILSSRPSPSAGEAHKLYKTALIGLVALFAYVVYQGWGLSAEKLTLTLICIGLAVWPAMRWLRTQPYQFPAFETFMLTCMASYALPMISDQMELSSYGDEVIIKALLAVILFQLSALITFHFAFALPKKTPFWNDEIFHRDISSWLMPGLWIHVIYISLSQFTQIIPYEIDSVLRAIFFGIATGCSYILGRSWGAGLLPNGIKTGVFLALLCAAIFQITSLYLINAIASVLVFFLAYISAGKRIPFVAIGLLFVILTILHNGKAAMREKYWDPSAPAVSIQDLPSFFTEWVNYGLLPFQKDSGVTKKRALLERASLLHIMCLVVDNTDRGLPFLSGETYANVPVMLIPRFFWPDKPSGQMTTRRLGIHFGLQDESSAKTTSIGFGVIAEAYANFGYFGVLLLGLLIGWSNKVVSIWTSNAPLISNGGFLMILLMAWAIQVEMPMSVWASSFFQASICMLGIPYVLKRIIS